MSVDAFIKCKPGKTNNEFWYNYFEWNMQNIINIQADGSSVVNENAIEHMRLLF